MLQIGITVFTIGLCFYIFGKEKTFPAKRHQVDKEVSLRTTQGPYPIKMENISKTGFRGIIDDYNLLYDEGLRIKVEEKIYPFKLIYCDQLENGDIAFGAEFKKEMKKVLI